MTVRKLTSSLLPAAALWLPIVLLVSGGAVHAQPDAEDKTLERAGKIASQPARDVGISKEKIPPILDAAVTDTYARPKSSCSSISKELVQLNAALGPDFDGPQKGDDQLTKLAEAGGQTVVNSLIPFRGLVREVTGAAADERRLRAAINAGVARRGFLRGIAAAKTCKLPVNLAAK
jgi:hypothetical protein